MPSNTTTPSMFLVVPTVGQELGPAYAQDLNSDLSLIDDHDHSLGKGVPITPAGLSISTDLSFQGNSAINLGGMVFTAQTSPSTILQSLSVAPGGESPISIEDLFYTDSAGNQIQITKGGNLNVSVASIPGESYSAGTFTWRQPPANTVPANFDIGSITVRPNIASTTFGVTIQPPAGIASAYDLALPPDPSTIVTSGHPALLTINQAGAMNEYLPAVTTQSLLTIDTSNGVGNVAATSPGQVLKQTTSNTPGFSFIGSNIQTITGAYSALVSDSTIYASGGAYAVTLYSPANNAGAEITIQKTDSSLSNVITITGSGYSTTLNTQNETVTLMCNGTTFIQKSRYNKTAPATYSPTVLGFGSLGPQQFLSWRDGRYLYIQGWFQVGSPTASAATMTVGMSVGNPSIDTTLLGTTGQVIGTYGSTATIPSNAGYMIYQNSSTTVAFSSYFTEGASMLQPTNGNTVTTAGTFMSMTFKVPISGWAD